MCVSSIEVVSFDCPDGLAVDELPTPTDEEKTKALVIFRATEGTLTPPMNLNVRQETGLRIAVSLTKQEIIQMILGNSEKAFPQRFPEYKKVSERAFELNGKKAGEIYFTYKGPAGEVIKQRFLVVAKDDNTVYYFALQAKETDFNQANSTYFDRITSSFKLN